MHDSYFTCRTCATPKAFIRWNIRALGLGPSSDRPYGGHPPARREHGGRAFLFRRGVFRRGSANGGALVSETVRDRRARFESARACARALTRGRVGEGESSPRVRLNLRLCDARMRTRCRDGALHACEWAKDSP
jgi:hypothetical protein